MRYFCKVYEVEDSFVQLSNEDSSSREAESRAAKRHRAAWAVCDNAIRSAS